MFLGWETGGPLNSFYEKNEIYHKVQCEKLYNLHETAFFFTVAHFKMVKTSSGQISTVRKRYFLAQDGLVFSYFIFLSPDIFYLKIIHHKMQRESSIVYTRSLSYSCTFRFQNR
jgi:hypothetical protein